MNPERLSGRLAARLAALHHENMIATMGLLAGQVPDGLVRRSDGVAIISSGIEFLLFNQVVVDGEATTPDPVRAAVDLMRTRGTRFAVNLRVGTDDRFVPLMAELGLIPLSADPWLPGMALHPLPDDRSSAVTERLEIRRVTDAASLDEHVRTAAAGFEIPESLMRSVMPLAVLGAEEATFYVGYTDGRPVTTGAGVRTGSTIGVYSIATLPDVRGHGYGAAMTRRVVADGAAAGCDVAILQASAMGFPIYERLGYRTVVEYMAYVEPQATPSVEAVA